MSNLSGVMDGDLYEEITFPLSLFLKVTSLTIHWSNFVYKKWMAKVYPRCEVYPYQQYCLKGWDNYKNHGHLHLKIQVYW